MLFPNSLTTPLKWTTTAFTLTLFLSANSGCYKGEQLDPKRCSPVNIGEATELADNPDVADNRMVVVEGLTDPRGLIWQDTKTTKTFLITKVLGTEQKLYYLTEIKPGQTPSVLSSIKGHLRRFDHLPKELAQAIVAGLKTEYKIELDLHKSFLVDTSTRPPGCEKVKRQSATGSI